MDDEAFGFATGTLAEVTMLRQAVTLLLAQHLRPMSPVSRERILSRFEEEVGEMPPEGLPDPTATRFREAVAAALPERVQSFTDDLRMILWDRAPTG